MLKSGQEPICVVLVGAPGAGKGVQARLLTQTMGLVHISSGDLFRQHLKDNTAFGHQVKGYLDRGELVPDDLTISMVMERLAYPDCVQGAILDGFPRTVNQARVFKECLAEQGQRLWAVACVCVTADELLQRLVGRRVCIQCKRAYHLKFNPPRVEGVCDYCGAPLMQRDDDTEETARNRLKVYFQETRPMLGYFREKGLLIEVDGEQSIEEVHEELLHELNAVKVA